MFWLFLGLCLVIFWVSWEFYFHAQRIHSSIALTRRHMRSVFEYFNADKAVPATNVRKTVAVDYKEGLPNSDNWDDDFIKTQCIDPKDKH